MVFHFNKKRNHSLLAASEQDSIPEDKKTLIIPKQELKTTGTEINECERVLVGHKNSVEPVVALPNGELASGGFDNNIHIVKTILLYTFSVRFF